MTDVKANLAQVRAEIDRAAHDAGRDPAAVTLVAVSKTHDAPAILPTIEAGQRVFGENRVQEAAGKWPALRERFPDLELHLIGPLQTNKLREALALFDVIQSVDRPKLARMLAEEGARAGRLPRLLVQVNTGKSRRRRACCPPIWMGSCGNAARIWA